MADIPNREALEAEMIRKLSKGLRKQYKLLLDKVGDPPKVENLTPEDLKEFDAILTRLLGSDMQDIYLDQAEVLLDAMPELGGMDWSVMNEAAASWSKDYVFDLVTKINKNSKKVLQDAISNYYEQGWTRAELEAALIREFGARRASTIAVTEVTRACAMGEAGLAEEINRTLQGYRLVPFWYTNEDELVCVDCGERNEKEIVNNDFPPAHPNCRCWPNWRLMKIDGFGRVVDA